MKETDYMIVLKAVKQLPFNVGKKLLVDFLKGNDEHPSISNNRLDLLSTFGEMSYSEDELSELIDSLLREGYLEYGTVQQNKFWKVIKLSLKGMKELKDPKRTTTSSISKQIKDNKTIISQDDRKMFAEFDFFLSKYNDEQKKAIISPSSEIICIAGAGSGKTSVLIKRIEFLIKFRSVPSSKILAVTFTRKAKEEMIKRLEKDSIKDVRVETFNSFCEKILNLHEKKIYNQAVKVMNYKDKILSVRKAIHELGIGTERAIKIYFSDAQIKSKTQDQLTLAFVNDIFMVLDYLKSKGRSLQELLSPDVSDPQAAELLYKICTSVEEQMKASGFRDYADQLMDTIRFFKEHSDLIPRFEHILVDEYQDVNSVQIELIELLRAKNLFCVGDPRQSIFGWRGSDIKYILNFNERYLQAETITLTKNYRSTKYIVDIMNKEIKKLCLPDIEAINEGEKDVRLLNFDSESAEYEFIAQRVLHSQLPREDIFILARTNRQLKDISATLNQYEIKHILKNDEFNKSIEAKKGEVTVATVHAIKGLEAKMVFVAGCNSLNFPCKASDHPATEIIKVEEYDKEEEERRLFYVAVSRAMSSLYLTYTGKSPTYFITEEMKHAINFKDGKQVHKDISVSQKLREWRLDKSKKEGVPPYIIMKDETLNELADKMPLTASELTEIKGLGPARIRRFGNEILSILNKT